MTANTTTVSSSRSSSGSAARGVSLGLMSGSARVFNAARLGWSRLALSGQLGVSREREIGRHTGARI